MNYLVLASSMLGEEASRVPAFFGEFGLEVVASPNLDRRGEPTNDPTRYTVTVLVGVPGNEFRARGDERRRLEQRVAQLGRIWQRERGGSTSFRDPLWVKHVE